MNDVLHGDHVEELGSNGLCGVKFDNINQVQEWRRGFCQNPVIWKDGNEQAKALPLCGLIPSHEKTQVYKSCLQIGTTTAGLCG